MFIKNALPRAKYTKTKGSVVYTVMPEGEKKNEGDSSNRWG
jgi:hypothetical protein